jgi:hypothetical protein
MSASAAPSDATRPGREGLIRSEWLRVPASGESTAKMAILGTERRKPDSRVQLRTSITRGNVLFASPEALRNGIVGRAGTESDQIGAVAPARRDRLSRRARNPRRLARQTNDCRHVGRGSVGDATVGSRPAPQPRDRLRCEAPPRGRHYVRRDPAALTAALKPGIGLGASPALIPRRACRG